MLVGDVRIRLEAHEFAANRAVVWMAPLPAGDPDAAPGVWQVFVYLDGARSIGASSVGVSGGRLPIRGIVRASGKAGDARDAAGQDGGGVQLHAEVLEQGRPEGDEFLIEAEAALRHRLARDGEGAGAMQPVDAAAGGGGEEAGAQQRPAPVARPDSIFAAEGILYIAPGDKVELQSGEEEDTLVFTGRPTLQYWDRQRGTTLNLSAQQAVVFLDPGTMAGVMRFDIERIRGIYLEGDVVASDGQYTVRAPRVYYDVREDRAVLVDAVFWTYDERRGMPLYLRAAMLRQDSASRFRARSAMLTNTAFFDPDLAIGVSSMTLTRKPEPGGIRNHLDVRNLTLRAAGLPFFYWPVLRGDPDAIPLRSLGVEASRATGTVIQSGWNLFSMLGQDAPRGHDASLLFDWYIERGPALGVNYSWSGEEFRGGLFAYGLFYDQGEDYLVGGLRSQPPQRMRGIATLEHQTRLSERWTMQLEGAVITDPTFAKAFNLRDQQNNRITKDRRELANSVYFRRLEENSLLTIEMSARLQDFLVSEHRIQTPGYSVDKLPEAMYFRAADDVLTQWPGLLTWTHEYRAGIMRLNFHEATARELGMNTNARANAFWGIAPDQSPADVLRARGLHEDPVMRFDTRHELAMPLKAGPVSMTPFVVGRLTVYDQDFDEYSAEMDDQYRLWGAAGVTVATEITRIDNSISSRFFDLHRMRHIIRPSVTLWHSESTIERVDMPIYDPEVEDLVSGSAVRFGLDQTWQTQRGGPGRWRSVDVFRLNAEMVVSSGEVDRKSPIPRHFDFRPEYGNLGGTFGSVEGAWQITEVVGVGGETVYDFEIDRMARTSIGATIQHNPDFSTFGEIRYLNAQDQTYAIFGAQYEFTRKYGGSFTTTYDTDRGEFSTFSAEFRRRFPNVVLGVSVTYNNITQDTSLGIVFQPVGLEQAAGARVRGIGATSPARRIGIGG